MSDEAEGVKISKVVALQLTEASQAGKLGPLQFQAKHWTLPFFKKHELNALQVTTRFRADAQQFTSRKARQHDYLIEVTMQQSISSEESLLTDHMILLAQEIGDFYQSDDTTTGQTRTLTGRDEKLVSPIEMMLDEEKLHELRVLKCVVTLTFRGWR